jgi:hypothetical protein
MSERSTLNVDKAALSHAGNARKEYWRTFTCDLTSFQARSPDARMWASRSCSESQYGKLLDSPQTSIVS